MGHFGTHNCWVYSLWDLFRMAVKACVGHRNITLIDVQDFLCGLTDVLSDDRLQGASQRGPVLLCHSWDILLCKELDEWTAETESRSNLWAEAAPNDWALFFNFNTNLYCIRWCSITWYCPWFICLYWIVLYWIFITINDGSRRVVLFTPI